MRYDRRNMIFAAIFTLFFGFLFITGEPVYAGDTFQYENQLIMREPGYALLMQLCRFLSPQGSYRLIILIQNILAIFTNTVFMIWIRKRFCLKFSPSLLFAAILLIPHVMTILFSNKHFALTNALMTEGVLFSLYPLSFAVLLDAVWEMKPFGRKSNRALAAFLLISLIRGQMMAMCIVWLIITCVIVLRNAIRSEKTFEKLPYRIIKEGIFYPFILIILAFAVRSGIIHAYNYFENGLFVDTASGKALAFANVLYAADREDAEAIKDGRLRAAFYEMYDSADADKMNYKYSPDGLLNRAAHQEKCHDDLNFIYFAEPAKRYVGETKGIYVDRYQELMIGIDEVARQIAAEIVPRLIVRYIYTYIAVAAQGFIRSVAYVHPLLVWYALIIYAAAAALTIILWKRNPKSKAAPFMAVVLLAIVGNVFTVALMVQCISRYMIYNMPLFYMAGLLELRELYSIMGNRKDMAG